MNEAGATPASFQRNRETQKVERDLKMITNKEAGFNIVPLPKKDWQGTIIPMRYTTSEYYDVAVDRRENGFQVTLEKACEGLGTTVGRYEEAKKFL